MGFGVADFLRFGEEGWINGLFGFFVNIRSDEVIAVEAILPAGFKRMDGAWEDDAHIPDSHAFFFVRDGVVDGPFGDQENFDIAMAMAIHIDVGVDHGVKRDRDVWIFANRLVHCNYIIRKIYE